MKKAVVLIGLTVGLFAAGCGDTTPPASGSASGAPSGSPAPSATTVALTEADLPVAADFEEEAEKDISAASYKSELDLLEKEVNAP